MMEEKVDYRLTDKSLTQLTSKHPDALGIDDPFPPNPNQKLTSYENCSLILFIFLTNI